MKVLALLAAALAGSPALPQDAPAEADPFVAFALAIEASMSRYDPSLLDGSVDYDAVIAAAVEGRSVDRMDAVNAKAGLAHRGLGAPTAERLERSGGTYVFLRMLPGDRALFRVRIGAGLDYQELHLSRGDDAIAIRDVYTYSADQRATEILATTLFEREYMEAVPTLTELMQVARTDPVAALALWDSLPELVQGFAHIQLTRVRLAAASGDVERYVEAMETFARLHPDSPARQLAYIDLYFLRAEHDEALALVDALDRRVDDPYLDILRANVLGAAGRSDEARRRFEAAYAGEPGLEEDALWTWLVLALGEEDHATALALLTRLDALQGIDWGAVEATEAYQALVRSQEYQRWKERSDEGGPQGEGEGRGEHAPDTRFVESAQFQR